MKDLIHFLIYLTLYLKHNLCDRISIYNPKDYCEELLDCREYMEIKQLAFIHNAFCRCQNGCTQPTNECLRTHKKFKMQALTVANKNTILHEINEKRNLLAGGLIKNNQTYFPIATNMKLVLWDSELETLAKWQGTLCSYSTPCIKAKKTSLTRHIQMETPKSTQEFKAIIRNAIRETITFYDTAEYNGRLNLEIRKRNIKYQMFFYHAFSKIGCSAHEYLKENDLYFLCVDCILGPGPTIDEVGQPIYHFISGNLSSDLTCAMCPKGYSCDSVYSNLCAFHGENQEYMNIYVTRHLKNNDYFKKFQTSNLTQTTINASSRATIATDSPLLKKSLPYSLSQNISDIEKYLPNTYNKEIIKHSINNQNHITKSLPFVILSYINSFANELNTSIKNISEKLKHNLQTMNIGEELLMNRLNLVEQLNFTTSTTTNFFHPLQSLNLLTITTSSLDKPFHYRTINNQHTITVEANKIKNNQTDYFLLHNLQPLSTITNSIVKTIEANNLSDYDPLNVTQPNSTFDHISFEHIITLYPSIENENVLSSTKKIKNDQLTQNLPNAISNAINTAPIDNLQVLNVFPSSFFILSPMTKFTSESKTVLNSIFGKTNLQKEKIENITLHESDIMKLNVECQNDSEKIFYLFCSQAIAQCEVQTESITSAVLSQYVIDSQRQNLKIVRCTDIRKMNESKIEKIYSNEESKSNETELLNVQNEMTKNISSNNNLSFYDTRTPFNILYQENPSIRILSVNTKNLNISSNSENKSSSEQLVNSSEKLNEEKAIDNFKNSINTIPPLKQIENFNLFEFMSTENQIHKVEMSFTTSREFENDSDITYADHYNIDEEKLNRLYIRHITARKRSKKNKTIAINASITNSISPVLIIFLSISFLY